MPPRFLNHVQKAWPASALALWVGISPAPGLADSRAPLQTRVELSDTVNLELRDWRSLQQGNANAGLPLVLLTGLGNTAAVYDDLAPLLARRQPVVALTRRGFGGSSAPATGYDVPTRVEDLRLALDRLGLERVVLVGHSIAGDELTAFAGRYPQRVAGLVYLDAALNRYSPTGADVEPECLQRVMAQAQARLPAELTLQAPDGERRLRSLAAIAPMLQLLGISPRPATELAAQNAWLAGGGIGPTASSERASKDLMEGSARYRPAYRALRMPFLALFGTMPELEISTLAPAERPAAKACLQLFLNHKKRIGVEDLRAQRPDATIEIWPDATHFLFLEHPQRTVDAIQRFVTALPDAR
jgi:pimeloyl-ACP methyl ester carboxylesterase